MFADATAALLHALAALVASLPWRWLYRAGDGIAAAWQALEALCFWTRSRPRNLALITELQGTELFDAALASGRGVSVAAPHYGNWELLNQWLAMRTPLAILYRCLLYTSDAAD